MKNKDVILKMAKEKINSFIQGRIYDINNNIEPVDLSVALIIKYSKGIVDIIYLIFEDKYMSDSLIKFTENKLNLITPEWKKIEFRRMSSMDTGITNDIIAGDWYE